VPSGLAAMESRTDKPLVNVDEPDREAETPSWPASLAELGLEVLRTAQRASQCERAAGEDQG